MAKPPLSLVENVITLLVHSNEHGRIVANLIDISLFEGEYALIAERATAYWAKYNCAPGAHIGDEFADILGAQRDPRSQSLRMILSQMSRLAESINTDYVLDKLRQFARLQGMKAAIYQAAEALQVEDATSIEEVETLLGDMLRARELNFAPGLNLENVDEALAFLHNRDRVISLNIEPLDNSNIGPRPGTLLCMIAPTGLGKSWFCVHVAKQALRQRKRVVHLSLEMSEEECLLRYYQSFFAIPKYQALRVTTTELDVAAKRIVEHTRSPVEPRFSFESPDIRLELQSHLRQLGGLTRNLKIKRFPPSRLTVGGIEAYLDTLEATENFAPDVLIVDYPKLMKLDANNLRISMGQTVENIRALCIERNMSGIMVHQSSKGGAKARMVLATDVAEDWSVVHTCDAVLTYSASPRERKLGLARIFVAKARSDRDRFAMLLTQNYDIGQFALHAVYLPGNYEDYLAHITPPGEDNEDQEDDEADDEAQGR